VIWAGGATTVVVVVLIRATAGVRRDAKRIDCTANAVVRYGEHSDTEFATISRPSGGCGKPATTGITDYGRSGGCGKAATTGIANSSERAACAADREPEGSDRRAEGCSCCTAGRSRTLETLALKQARSRSIAKAHRYCMLVKLTWGQKHILKKTVLVFDSEEVTAGVGR
jgi:hypothetical protein